MRRRFLFCLFQKPITKVGFFITFMIIIFFLYFPRFIICKQPNKYKIIPRSIYQVFLGLNLYLFIIASYMYDIAIFVNQLYIISIFPLNYFYII